ncbi:hypothetical protein Y032_0060g3185 [Ancylostoma ceylanicum]|uniref:Uncharacterized protein n=1 Tax=Ancylostoma ceylanicum TaxID=53326 RepID=A0A016U385_9BILA|nr:hypothetical protein Y032_0060g3185 [Ancylostoma ceylanicum]
MNEGGGSKWVPAPGGRIIRTGVHKRMTKQIQQYPEFVESGVRLTRYLGTAANQRVSRAYGAHEECDILYHL